MSEYGVHWNFFFTLCATSIIFAVSRVPLSTSPYIAGVILVGTMKYTDVPLLRNLFIRSAAYEVALVRFGLREELLSDTRPTSLGSVSDFIWMNKEGVFSLFGTHWGRCASMCVCVCMLCARVRVL